MSAGTHILLVTTPKLVLEYASQTSPMHRVLCVCHRYFRETAHEAGTHDKKRVRAVRIDLAGLGFDRPGVDRGSDAVAGEYAKV